MTRKKQPRILSIAPTTRGFGFAVLEEDKLVDWGVKVVKGNKNTMSLVRIEELIDHYHPEIMVLEDHTKSRRAPRIQELGGKIITLAKSRQVKVKTFTRKQVRGVFFSQGTGTKFAVAEALARLFPEELGSQLPPKRRLWTSEDSRMDIFDAVALVVAFRMRRIRRTLPK